MELTPHVSFTLSMQGGSGSHAAAMRTAGGGRKAFGVFGVASRTALPCAPRLAG